MISHANRNLLAAIAGATLLFGSSVASAKGANDLGSLELQNPAAMEFGDEIRGASVKALFGSNVESVDRLLVCGDSEPDAGEECDDGNTTPGDGCSATCTIEPGFLCTDAVAGQSSLNVIGDGSFELNDGSWTISGWIAGRCNGALCLGDPTANFASDGEFWVWVGGVGDTPNSGSAVQTVALPANASTLTFDVLSAASGCGDSTINVQVNSAVQWSYEDQGNGECITAAPFDYENVSIDISAFAGTTVTITLFGDYVPAGGGLNANWFFDNFRIDVPLVPPVPPVPSACSAVVCGDGLQAGIDPSLNGSTVEACDDGNTTPGDGCSATCTIEEPDFVCDDAVIPAASGDDISDGSLEEGSPNPFWAETGTQFDPICSDIFCGATLSSDGAFFAWFGGSSMPNAQTLTQDVDISATSTDLTFQLLVGVCDSANDSLTIEINGNEEYRYDCTADTSGFETVTVEITAYQGTTATVQINGNTEATNGSNSNFFVDEISILDNAPFAGEPSACFELPTSCDTIEQFEAGIPAGWTVINLGADAADGWGTTTDGICGSQNWPGGNVTGGGGIAACADSDATGQIDIDAGGGMGTPLEMDTYLCSPALDLSQVTDPQFSFLVNFQSAENDLNDNGTPTDTSDDFDDDFLEVLINVDDMGGTLGAPNAFTVPAYSSLGQVFDHLDGSLAISPDAALSADLTAQNALTEAYVCFHYLATYSWYAQIDNAGLRGSECVAPVDSDLDGVPDSIDNCTNVPNAGQQDGDGDGYGNLCDADFNNDCIVNPIDLGLFRTVFFTNDPEADLNSDGIVNPIDLGLFRTLFFTTPGPSATDTLNCNP